MARDADPGAVAILGEYRATHGLDNDTGCAVCGLESCADASHIPPTDHHEDKARELQQDHSRRFVGFDHEAVVSLDTLKAEGRAIREAGVPYVIDGVIPRLGLVGFFVAGAKVGKTTTGLKAIKAISGTAPEFLGLAVQHTSVLMLALEDPREYLAVLVDETFDGGERATFYPHPLQLDEETLDQLAAYVMAEQYGLIYVATFLNAVRGLVDDENDNAGMVRVVNTLKVFARRVGVPLLLEAHAGKGEDLSEDADPVKALRGASAAAAEADFLLSLRRAKGGFATQRRLSGLGRFVRFSPITFDLNPANGELTVLDSGDAQAAAETDWRLICETGALTSEPLSAGAIARAAGMIPADKTVTKPVRIRVERALRNRSGVRSSTLGDGRGSRTTYTLDTQAVSRAD